ncbi:hypothetical protein ACFL1H_01330 [Nanoarchaeota archaeon]
METPEYTIDLTNKFSSSLTEIMADVDTLFDPIRRHQFDLLDLINKTNESYQMALELGRRYQYIVYSDIKETHIKNSESLKKMCIKIMHPKILYLDGILTLSDEKTKELNSLRERLENTTFIDDVYDVGEGWEVEPVPKLEMIQQDVKTKCHHVKEDLYSKISGQDKYEDNLHNNHSEVFNNYENSMRKLGIHRVNSRKFLMRMMPKYPLSKDKKITNMLDFVSAVMFNTGGDIGLFQAMQECQIPSKYVRNVVDHLEEYQNIVTKITEGMDENSVEKVIIE